MTNTEKNPIFDRITLINSVAHNYMCLNQNPKTKSDAIKLSKKFAFLKSSRCPTWMQKKLGKNWQYYIYSPMTVKKAPFLLE